MYTDDKLNDSCCTKRILKRYREIPTISPGLIFVQKAVLLGLFAGELIFGGAYYWKEFCVSKWVGLGNKNSLNYENRLKQLKTASTKSPWAYISEELIIGRIFASEIWGGGSYFREGLFLGGLIIRILWYLI